MSLAAGSRLGPYEVLGKLGEGGMGEVYRAHDTRLRRDVAIKVISSRFADDPERLARFEREARVLASLNHPAIGAIYGLEHGEVPALILELVEGDTLADRLRRGPLPVATALGVARQIADALDVAHERGIVHRDLKPGNIKINDDDHVKVLDFGLAKALANEPEGGGLSDPSNSPTITVGGTRDGVILGTAAYMSPEQARGRLVDKRTDVWAFGCVLYEMLTGTLAFRGESTTDTIVSILEREPDFSRLPQATPDRARLLLQRCLQKDPRKRLRDIADARFDLDDAIANPRGHAVSADPARRPVWPMAAALALIIAAAASAGWFAGRVPPAAQPPVFDRLVRLVSTAAHEFGPVISPDGKWVAYLSNARGATDIWVKYVAGGDPVNLTATSGIVVQSQDYINGLAVSPDGSQLAFQAQAPSQLGAAWVIPAPLGGAPRRMLPVGSSGVQWSPDGKRIAYVKTGGSLGDSLAVSDADGQNEVELVKREGARHTHWLRWDRGGAFIYFNRGFQNFNIEPTEIFRVPAGGGPIERVVASARRAIYPFPDPTRDGLFFAANPDSVDLGLWWRDLTAGRDHRITSGVGEYGAPSVSADGQRLAGTVMEVRQSLQRVAINFDRAVALEPVTDGLSGDEDPAWSPDGSRLVFSSARTGSRTLWTSRADLSQQAPLTTGNVLDERPVFSPDGQQIAFISDRGGRRGIWVVSADAGSPRLIGAADVVDMISWSPDGRRLVFSTPVGDAPGLMIMDVATGQTTRVPTPAAATAPSWSVEDVIAYIEPRGGNLGAFVKFVRPDGAAAYDPPAPAMQQFGNAFVSWSADGRRLAAVALPGGFAGSIWIIEPASRPAFRKLLDLPAGVFLRGVTWSRDGSSLLVGRVQWAGDIFYAERGAQ